MVIYIIYRNRNGFKNCFQTRPLTEIVKVRYENMSNIYRNCKDLLQKSYLENKQRKKMQTSKISLINSVNNNEMIFENNKDLQKLN